jgi:HAD superfamily hydrolase (TIGR01509 family)
MDQPEDQPMDQPEHQPMDPPTDQPMDPPTDQPEYQSEDGPRLIVFDCDGVLVDSEDISNQVLAQMLTEEGVPTTLAESRRDYQGLLLSDVLADAEQRLGRPFPEGWLDLYEERRSQAFRRELEPIEGIAEAIEFLTAAGLAVCVASQGKLAKTRLSLELTGLRGLFDDRTIFSAYQVPRGKPHPDLFLYAARTMGFEPARCVVVEDTPSGVNAAVSAGMRVLGYTADSDARALIDAGAETFLSMRELPARLG